MPDSNIKPQQHLIKLCVGVETLLQLREIQAERAARGLSVVHVTRHRPKRAATLLAGGSLYWVIRGMVSGRQLILDLARLHDAEDRPCCGLVLDPIVVATQPYPHRPFQGWRYLDSTQAPPDFLSDLPINSGPEANRIEKARQEAELQARLQAIGLL